MEQYLDRNGNINHFYNEFIMSASAVDDANPNKFAWLCGWSDKHNQYKRLEVLSQIGIKNNDSVLDVGCGAGEFIQYSLDNNLKLVYLGVDINPVYLQIAKMRFPTYAFALSNAWDLVAAEFDWAIASGIFTIEANMTYINWYVGFIMERLVKKGFAFNLLTNNASEGLINYNPDDVVAELTERFPDYKIELVKDYLPDDFTIYVKKK